MPIYSRPSENKWAKKEILGHLLDSAANNHQCFVRATLQSSLTFRGYDQNALVDLQNFAEIDCNTNTFLVDFRVSPLIQLGYNSARH